MSRIFFYEDTYYFFSNFSAHAVLYKGFLYPTSEHAYQAEKFDDDKIKKEISSAKSPMESKNIANHKYRNLRKANWDNIKVKIMYQIVKRKILQHKEIMDTLISSGDAEIIENSPVDYFWGCGKNKTGKNEMGKVLMKIREELKT